jgi:hypothetical protein
VFATVCLVVILVHDFSLVVYAFAENLLLLLYILMIGKVTMQLMTQMQIDTRIFTAEFKEMKYHESVLKAFILMTMVVLFYMTRVFLYLFNVLPSVHT